MRWRIHQHRLYRTAYEPDESGLFINVSTQGFEYEGGAEAYRRECFRGNIGLVTEKEQYEKIPNFRIAIAGMGAVGSAHLTSLARQGFENFNIADSDRYEHKNTQRQMGANVATIGGPKAEVMSERFLEINPYGNIRMFPQVGRNTPNVFPFTELQKKTLDAFLDEDVKLAIDAIDFFNVNARRDFVNAACEKGIPVISAGPIGFGTAYLIFMPGGPNFDQYYNTSFNMHEDWMLMYFLAGTAPKRLHKQYMSDPKMMFESIVRRKPPSLKGAIDLCAGVTALGAVKILLGKGEVKAVPYYHQYDVRRGEFVCKKSWWGNRNPLVKWAIGKILHTLRVDELRKWHETRKPGEKLIED
jgi:molybdopterin/thiamine biosynthesis adenylyltransferase